MPRQLAIMAILTMGVRETQGTFAPLSRYHLHLDLNASGNYNYH